MSWLGEVWRRAKHYRQADAFQHELDDEIRFHIETRADDLEREGLARDAAIMQARREFGHRRLVSEDVREAWLFRWMEELFGDLRYAARAFRKHPAFAATAILSLALGIGVNTTIFSVTTEFLFSQPSGANPDTLAAIRVSGRSHRPMRDYRFLNDAAVFPGLAGSREDAEVNWRNGDASYRLWASRVTGNYFSVIGAPVALGRAIEPGDRDVVVITHPFWQGRLGGRPDVLGRTVILDGQPHAIIGVLPADHRSMVGFGFLPDLYLPVLEDTVVALYARLPAGMSHAEAAERMSGPARELYKTYPDGVERTAGTVRVRGVDAMGRMNDKLFLPVATFFAVLMTVVGLLLLIACANVASLLLARASSRTQELAIRLCMGASRSRVARQLLAESLLLAALGTVGGIGLNLLATNWLSRIDLGLPLPIHLNIQPDWRLLVYSVAVAFGTALVAGLAPALKAGRADVNAALKREERQVGSGRFTLRNALVAGQLAVSVVLLTTAFLFVRNLLQSTSLNPGFDVDRTVWAHMRLVPERYPTKQKTAAVIERSLESLRTLPGVESAAIARVVPLNDTVTRGMEVRTDISDTPVHIEHNMNRVGPDYFRTMGIPMLDGREFRETDREGAPDVAIINQEFAERAFGAVNPVGHTVRIGEGRWTIVGLARNSKYFTLGEEDTPAMYQPYQQPLQLEGSFVNLHFLIRTPAPPPELVRAVNERLLAVDDSAALEVRPMNRALGLALLPSRAGAGILGAVGVLGLTLAAVGLYGVLIYAVSRRIREIGLRRALGAQRTDIIRMVLGDAAWLVGTGGVIGLGISLLVTRPLTLFLVPGLKPTDPVSYVATVGVLATVALIAALFPTLRALRVDPMTALRHE